MLLWYSGSPRDCELHYRNCGCFVLSKKSNQVRTKKCNCNLWWAVIVLVLLIYENLPIISNLQHNVETYLLDIFFFSFSISNIKVCSWIYIHLMPFSLLLRCVWHYKDFSHIVYNMYSGIYPIFIIKWRNT